MKSKLLKIFSYIESDLIERTVPVRLSLLAALSGEHLLLLGPPGTAKSKMARKLCHTFSNINYFERLLTRFSVPEELFGPLSIKALENDRYHRLTKSYLPAANVAFIDEIFKANSAILNSLLTLLNEREFDNGSVREKVVLITVIAASNELPEDETLDALFDRFLLRYQLSPVSDAGFDSLINLTDSSEISESVFDALTVQDIEDIQFKSASIKLSEDAHGIFCNLRLFLTEKEIYISDRRWRKSLKILQVSVYTNGRKNIDKWDCLLLSHFMWQTPEQFKWLNDWFVEELKLDIKSSIKRVEKLLLVWEQQLLNDIQKNVQKTNTDGEKLYLTPEGKTTTQCERVSLAERDNQILFLAPPDQQDRTNAGQGYTLAELEQDFFDDNFKQTHIDGRWVDVKNYINNTQNRLVNRVEFDPLVDTYYFSQEYIDNQYAEIAGITNNVNAMYDDFNDLQSQLKTVALNNIWLSGSIVDTACENITSMLPVFIDFQQRLQVLSTMNKSLKVKDTSMASN